MTVVATAATINRNELALSRIIPPPMPADLRPLAGLYLASMEIELENGGAAVIPCSTSTQPTQDEPYSSPRTYAEFIERYPRYVRAYVRHRFVRVGTPAQTEKEYLAREAALNAYLEHKFEDSRFAAPTDDFKVFLARLSGGLFFALEQYKAGAL